MKNINVVILAAGEGTRMKSKMPKVLHEVMGKPMIKRVIDTAYELGAQNICVVTGHKSEEVQEALKNENVTFAEQEKQLGTGHAVMQAEKYIEDNEDVLILYGDTPLIKAETLQKLIDYHRSEDNGVSIISAVVDNSEGYGHIIRDKNGNFVKNVEYKDATEEEKLVKEINSGIYCFKGSSLKKALKLITNDNVQGEYYLPDTLEIILIGCDTIIYPGCVLEGKTVIGEDCKVGSDVRLTDMKLSDNVTIQYTVAMESEVGSGTKVGPFAYIRPNSKIGENIKIGDFVEVKNSVIGNGTKVSHLTYIGDSDVGERINFGCGTVTVNYDGHKKFRTTIEDDVFIGCNANLVAPVTLKKGSYVAAGSTITKDVPEKALAVARNRQQNIEGWTKK